MSQENAINISKLSAALNLSIMQIRTLVRKRKIPFLKIGHRTLLFEPSKVRAALRRFEVKEIGQPKSLTK